LPRQPLTAADVLLAACHVRTGDWVMEALAESVAEFDSLYERLAQ
jgi:hypothetical protein